MKREPQGHYVTVSTQVEQIRAFVPCPAVSGRSPFLAGAKAGLDPDEAMLD